MKKIIKGFLVILMILLAVFVICRYGWKFAGFNLCQNSIIYDVKVNDDSVVISGRDVNLVPRGFIGYYYQIEDDCMYIGFRFSSIFGFFEKGAYEIEIKTESKVNKIIMKSEKSETVIYDIYEEGNMQPWVDKLKREVGGSVITNNLYF